LGAGNDLGNTPDGIPADVLRMLAEGSTSEQTFMAIRILDIGECGFDGPRMAALWQKKLGAQVDRIASGEEAQQRLDEHDYNLVLVNRVLAVDGSSGLDVIKTLRDTGTKVPVMLVSDLADAQDAAVELGAVRGFGKSRLEDQSTLDLVERVARGDAA
jgi:CheY-like chemotaxis protein